MFWANDYENSTDSYGLKYCWIEIVTHWLFQVVVSSISICIHKGGIHNYITISRADSCNEKIRFRIQIRNRIRQPTELT